MEGNKISRWSARPQQEEFREEIRSHAIKECKKCAMVVLIVFAVIAVEGFVFSGGKSAQSIFAPLAIVLLLLVIGAVIFGVKTITGINKPPAEGEVIQFKKWYESANEDHDRRTRHLIVIKTDKGKKKRIRDLIAEPYYYILKEGDRVRYHAGFSYPLEPFEKREQGGNVCVFCGKVNMYNAHTCERCGKPMLI